MHMETSLIQWKLIPANPGTSAGDTLLGATDSYPGREGGIHFQGGAGAPQGVAGQSRCVERKGTEGTVMLGTAVAGM